MGSGFFFNSQSVWIGGFSEYFTELGEVWVEAGGTGMEIKERGCLSGTAGQVILEQHQWLWDIHGSLLQTDTELE